MTLDEAIKHAEEFAEGHEKIKRIKAVTLEECKSAEEHRQLAEWLKDYKRLLEQESCEDCISRNMVLSEVKSGMIRTIDGENWKRVNDNVRDIRALPPVTPQPKMGRWIAYEVRLPDRTILNYRCSVCGRKLIGYNTETLSEAPFCHCGAKMEEQA